MRTFFTLLFFCGMLLPSSSSAKTIKVIGTFTDFELKQREGEFLIPVQYLNKEIVYRLIQWRILFENSKGQELLLTPVNCIAFQFYHKEKWVKFISVENIYEWKNPFQRGQRRVFLEAKVFGKVSLLNYYGYKHSDTIYFENGSHGGIPPVGGPRAKPQLFFYKNSRLIQFEKSSWKQQVKSLIWRNQDLVEEVNQCKKKHLVSLIERYNQLSMQKNL